MNGTFARRRVCLIWVVLASLLYGGVAHAEPIYKEYKYRFEEYYDWYIPFKQAVRSRDKKAIQTTYENLVSERPENFFIANATLDLAKYDFSNGDEDAARTKLMSLLSNSPVFKEKALTLLIQEALKRNDKQAVLKWYGQLISQCPDADLNNDLWSDIQETFLDPLTLNDTLLTFNDKLGYLRNLVRKEFYIRAKDVGLLLLPECKTPKIRSEVEFLIGYSYYKLMQPPSAADFFKQSLKHDKKSPFYEDTQFYLARSYEESGEFQKAEQQYLENLRKKKDNRELSKNYFYLVSLYKTYGPYENQLKMESEFKNLFPNDKYYKKYLWISKWDAFRKESDQSPTKLKKMMENERAYEKIEPFYSNQTAKKRIKQHPLSFELYSLLLTWAQAEKKIKNVVIDRYDTLKKIGLEEMAIDEIRYRYFQRSVSSYSDREAWVYIYYDKGDYYNAVDEAKLLVLESETTKQPISRFVVEALYPKAYEAWVQKYAKKFRVEPEILWALMREESQFFPRYTSISKKSGLCPISSEVAKEVAWRMGENWNNLVDLKDPETNIKFATYYLSDLLKQFNGNIHLAILAFHHSPIVASKIAQKTKSHDLNTILKETPYADGRELLVRFNDSYIAYKLF